MTEIAKAYVYLFIYLFLNKLHCGRIGFLYTFTVPLHLFFFGVCLMNILHKQTLENVLVSIYIDTMHIYMYVYTYTHMYICV